ncbi:glutaredoxin [Fomitopsis serialis]|uniref:glutaredoxin n=1 Tax=Fomitopsis serialis TaxID=139415 RepID=UPI002007CEB6|nr:glutaredoxin [Neoantrodia serialis]KAH9917273.1 glutaredoxin [Neoantrodia serialis]
MSATNFHEVNSADHFQQLLSTDLERVSLINFWAPWAEPCKQMNEVVMVLQVEAEQQSDIAESFEIEAVPAFIVLRVRSSIHRGHTLLARISGADASALTDAITTHARSKPSIKALAQTDAAPAEPEKEETQEQLNERLRGLMSKDKVVLFMKGEPDAPRCGFSRRMVALLAEQEVSYSHFDILSDDSVRQGLKVLNSWPTFPQLIINGEFVGGLDIIQEMVENGELKELLVQ